MTDNDDKLINAARAFVGLTVEVAEVRTILLRALDALAREPRREAALTQTVAGLNAAEARERRVREWMEGMQRDADDERNDADNRARANTVAAELRAILDGESTPVEAPPTILLDALKAGTIAEEVPERHWMVMQDPDGSWAAWSCGPHEGYRLHNDKCGLTREQAEDEGRASGLRPFDGKVTP